MQTARGIPSTLKKATLAKAELSYLTAFFQGRTVVKTQFDRDASRRLATFIYYCNLYIFLLKREIVFTPVKSNRRSTFSGSEKRVVRQYSVFRRWFWPDGGSQGLRVDGLLMRSDSFFFSDSFCLTTVGGNFRIRFAASSFRVRSV